MRLKGAFSQGGDGVLGSPHLSFSRTRPLRGLQIVFPSPSTHSPPFRVSDFFTPSPSLRITFNSCRFPVLPPSPDRLMLPEVVDPDPHGAKSGAPPKSDPVDYVVSSRLAGPPLSFLRDVRFRRETLAGTGPTWMKPKRV